MCWMRVEDVFVSVLSFVRRSMRVCVCVCVFVCVCVCVCVFVLNVVICSCFVASVSVQRDSYTK